MTVFNNDGASDNGADSYENYVKRFTKEDGTVDHEALLKKSFNQEIHIEKLESETDRFREDLKARTTLEEILDKIEKAKLPSSGDPLNPPNDPPNTPSNPIDLEAVVNAKLTDFEKKLAYQQNVDYVKNELTKAWGSDYVNKLRAKAKELGETEQFLENLAATKPKTFLSLVNPPSSRAPDYAPPKNEIRTPSGNSVSLNTYADFQKIKKEDPNLYWSPRIQDRLFEAAKAAKARGEDFYKKT